MRKDQIIKELKNMIKVEENFIKNFGALGFTKIEGEIKINVWKHRILKLSK